MGACLFLGTMKLGHSVHKFSGGCNGFCLFGGVSLEERFEPLPGGSAEGAGDAFGVDSEAECFVDSEASVFGRGADPGFTA